MASKTVTRSIHKLGLDKFCRQKSNRRRGGGGTPLFLAYAGMCRWTRSSVSCLKRDSEMRSFCLKQGQGLQAWPGHGSTPLPKLPSSTPREFQAEQAIFEGSILLAEWDIFQLNKGTSSAPMIMHNSCKKNLKLNIKKQIPTLYLWLCNLVI